MKKITETSKLNISLVEIILSEEKCGEGMYWCNTNKECKPLPSGFNTPGQTIKPTEVGIGVPVEGSCNHTKKGKTCPIHGKSDCTVDDPVDEACWVGYKQVGMKKKGKKIVPNCVKEEDVTIEDLNGNTFAEVIDIIKPEPIKGFKSQVEEATRLQADTGNIIAVILSWRGKTYSVRMFFPQVGMPNRKDVTSEIQKIYPDALVLQYKISGLQPGMPLIQVVNSKSKNYNMNEESAAWQRKEGKNPEGGLNAKGVASYRRENPGSKLQTAVTTEPSKLKPGSKAANRRKSFCARMGGMPGPMKDEKGRPTRKALSLRKWNC